MEPIAEASAARDRPRDAREEASAAARGTRFTLERRLAVAFAGAVIAVTVMALAVFDTARRALEASRWVAHTQQVLEGLDGMLGGLAQVEAAVYAYALTDEGAYLARRDRALSLFESRSQKLGGLLADNPLQQRRWRVLRHIADEQIALLDRVVVVRQTEGAAAARELLMLSLPHQSAESMRSVFQEMQQEEYRLMKERVQAEERQRTIAVAAGLLLAATFVVLFAAAYRAIRRQLAERKAAEARVVVLNRRLEERARELESANRDLESFSYSVSHDLRAPLRAIDGFSRILEEEYGERLDGEGRRLLAVVRDNSRRMSGLIDDLLEFSRLGRKPLATADVDMTQLARETFGQLVLAAERAPGFTLAPLPPARGDPALLRQVWANLLANAIKFSAGREAPLVEVSGGESGPENVYCVKDNGAGFDMRYYDKLFGVFQRLHGEEFEGTGVGLAIVQRVIARHGGRVWAEGRPGEGAAFYFSLPREARDGEVREG
ncbi:MAG TPA: CHASE3 domain-containing protein [Burkholderiales bacterium]|nr:CHASE3 domain-containing protein [Burkholderiales bacterium]